MTTNFQYRETFCVLERLKAGDTISQALHRVFPQWAGVHSPIGPVADEAMKLYRENA